MTLPVFHWVLRSASFTWYHWLRGDFTKERFMNNYERYMGMVRGEKVDIVPRIPILMHYCPKHIRTTYADFARDPLVMFEANKQLALDFGFEQLDIMSDPYHETTAFGGQIAYRDEGVPRCTAPLEHAKDLSLLAEPDPEKSERLKSALACEDAYREFGHRQYSITGWIEGPAAEAATLRGVSNFLVDLLEDEPFACDLMDRCVDVAIAYAKAQLAHGCDTIGMGDAIASQIAPSTYERLIAPREKRIVDAIRDAGGLARLHICGNINHLIPHIAGVGVDVLDCDWQVDMARARRILRRKVTLTGNLDPVNAVMKSTPEKIHAAFRQIYEQVGNPYFVNAGCEIPADTPVENLRAVCEPIEAK
jgi:MtaA/CmuA family methyltransferase